MFDMSVMFRFQVEMKRCLSYSLVPSRECVLVYKLINQPKPLIISIIKSNYISLRPSTNPKVRGTQLS